MRKVIYSVFAVLLLLAVVMTGQAAEKIIWKPVTLAVLKVDGRPAKIWNVYVASKKERLVLVQLGRRYLVLDTELEEVSEVPQEAFRRKGKDLEWERAEKTKSEDTEAQGTQRGSASGEKRLASENWWIHDAGRARIIRLRLSAEGRVLEVQLPLQPDLRILY